MFSIHDYNLCFNGPPYYTSSYYNDASVWPYYIFVWEDILRKNNIEMSSDFVKNTAEYLYKAYYKRRSLIYY